METFLWDSVQSGSSSWGRPGESAPPETERLATAEPLHSTAGAVGKVTWSLREVTWPLTQCCVSYSVVVTWSIMSTIVRSDCKMNKTLEPVEHITTQAYSFMIWSDYITCKHVSKKCKPMHMLLYLYLAGNCLYMHTKLHTLTCTHTHTHIHVPHTHKPASKTWHTHLGT